MDNENISLDAFLKGQIKIYQNNNGYKSGVDAVLLAASVIAKKGDIILDLGMGVGVVSLLIATRIKGVEVIGLEREEEFYKLACKNKLINPLIESSFTPQQGDILQQSPFKQQFNIICSNPPYYKDNHSQQKLKDIANIESDATMADFVKYAFANLKNHGYFYIIQRSERLKELLDLLIPKHWGNIEIFPIFSYKNKQAKRFIIKAKKLGKNISILHYGIVLHNSDGSYSEGAKNILEKGQGFSDNINNNKLGE